MLCFGERHMDDYVQAFGLQAAATRQFILQPADLAKTLQVLEHDGTTWIISPPLAGAGADFRRAARSDGALYRALAGAG